MTLGVAVHAPADVGLNRGSKS